MAGIQSFTYANFGKEATKGSATAPLRQLYFTGTGVLDYDIGLTLHENENRGSRFRIARATSQSLDAALKLATQDGVMYDNLPYILKWLVGGGSASGGTAGGSWDFTPVGTAANSPDSYTIDVGDDVQNYRVEYCMARSIKLSAQRAGVLQVEADVFGRQVTKTAKATPATNASPSLPGDQFQLLTSGSYAGLAAGTALANLLLDWDLTIDTGVRPRHYMDGNKYFGQHVETDIGFELNMTVESQATAVSQFYDKWVAQTQDYLRLLHTGPTGAGGSNYKLALDMSLIYSKVEPISAEEDGVNLYRVAAAGYLDSTSGKILGPSVVCGIGTA